MKIIHQYIDKLIHNLPDNIKNVNTMSIQKLDLILDGGVFNGSYLIGALYFLKEMEKQRYITVERVSACSIGSICGILYYVDSLDTFYKLYDIFCQDFKENYHLQKIKELHFYLNEIIPNDFYKKINKKFFVTYYNIKKKKKIVKSIYKNNEDLIETIIKSCFVPFLIDGTMSYKKKYIDGINPYIFPCEKYKSPDNFKKILFLDLYGYDKINYMINVKNEKTNFHRILAGLLDIHCFYIKQSSTSMCSYVDEWGCITLAYIQIKKIIEYTFIHFIYFVLLLQKWFPAEVGNSIFYKLISKIIYICYSTLLDRYVF